MPRRRRALSLLRIPAIVTFMILTPMALSQSTSSRHCVDLPVPSRPSSDRKAARFMDDYSESGSSSRVPST